MLSLATEFPKISVVLPVQDQFSHLEETVFSALNQTYPHFEVILYDDCCTDPGVRAGLESFRDDPRVRILRGKTREGLATAANRAIVHSTGDYLAFFDENHLLPAHALETAWHYIRTNPRCHYFFSCREDSAARGSVSPRQDFSSAALAQPENFFHRAFYGSLRIISRPALYEAGLLKKEFEPCQDYDLALRMTRSFAFYNIPELLCRAHPEKGPAPQAAARSQAISARRARDLELVRRKIFSGDTGKKKVSIIMLTMNRRERTRISLSHLVSCTSLSYELILLDNNSTDGTADLLKLFAGQHKNTLVILEGENLGCAGGRQRALAEAGGDYIVMLDNDIRVTPWWLENLLARLSESEADAACCRVVLPDGMVQYNGGSFWIRDGFILFSFLDSNLRHSDLSTLMDRRCDWLPGGATIYRRRVFDRLQFCTDLRGGLEDNDLSLQMARAGFTMVNSPASLVVHHHHRFESGEFSSPGYSRSRYDREAMFRAMVTFYRRHGLIIYDPWVFKHLDIPHGTREETLDFFIRQEGLRLPPREEPAPTPPPLPPSPAGGNRRQTIPLLTRRQLKPR